MATDLSHRGHAAVRIAALAGTAGFAAVAAILLIHAPAHHRRPWSEIRAAERRRCDALLALIRETYSARRPRPELVNAIEDETAAMRAVDGYRGGWADPASPLQTCTRPPNPGRSA